MRLHPSKESIMASKGKFNIADHDALQSESDEVFNNAISPTEQCLNKTLPTIEGGSNAHGLLKHAGKIIDIIKAHILGDLV